MFAVINVLFFSAMDADRGLESDTGSEHESQSQSQKSVAAFRQLGDALHTPRRIQRRRQNQSR